MDWLDAARYADSNGYQVDRDRELWAWRDWVIRAFNDNTPFDQFTIEQIAGDLLPDATRDQRIASLRRHLPCCPLLLTTSRAIGSVSRSGWSVRRTH